VRRGEDTHRGAEHTIQLGQMARLRCGEIIDPAALELVKRAAYEGNCRVERRRLIQFVRQVAPPRVEQCK